MTMCENFKRIDALIVEKNLKYIPDNWLGKDEGVVQVELLEHILVYILKLAFDELMWASGKKLPSEDEWYPIAKKKINEYAFWYAEDILDDLCIFYKFDNLVGHLGPESYENGEGIQRIYKLYVKSTDCEPSVFYEKIYEFVDEELKDMDD
jgi:hypothetical protein